MGLLDNGERIYHSPIGVSKVGVLEMGVVVHRDVPIGPGAIREAGEGGGGRVGIRAPRRPTRPC